MGCCGVHDTPSNEMMTACQSQSTALATKRHPMRKMAAHLLDEPWHEFACTHVYRVWTSRLRRFSIMSSPSMYKPVLRAHLRIIHLLNSLNLAQSLSRCDWKTSSMPLRSRFSEISIVGGRFSLHRRGGSHFYGDLLLNSSLHNWTNCFVSADPSCKLVSP
jgi:hypothetical protein